MINEFNSDGIAFPVMQKQYNKIETQTSIAINIFGYENKQPYPIYFSKEKFEDKINLFLIFTPKNSQFLKPQNLLQLLLISTCFSREIEATI